MPKSLDDLLTLAEAPVEVTVGRGKKPVRLRWPSFAEWHALSVSHRQLAGQDPPAELVARTVAVCVANAEGEREYQDADVPKLLEGDPRVLMQLYVKCWETVLRNDDQALKGEEGN